MGRPLHSVCPYGSYKKRIMIHRILEIYAKILTVLMTIMMYLLLFAVALQVMGRYIPFVPRYLWPLELTNFSLIWLIFLGSVIAVRERKHFFVDLFPDNLKPGPDKFLKILYFFVLYSVCLIFIFFGYRYFVKWGLIQTSDLTGLNLGVVYFSVPFAGVSWFIFLTEDLYKEFFTNKNKTEAMKG